jgi:hypothetical protein
MTVAVAVCSLILPPKQSTWVKRGVEGMVGKGNESEIDGRGMG